MLKKLTSGLLITVLLMACGKPSVLYSSEKMLDGGYANYKTYAFLPTMDTMYAKLVDRKVFVPALVQEARYQLEKKGLVLDTANPDCLFTYTLVMQRKYSASQEQTIAYNQQVHSAASMPMYNYSTSGISGSSSMRAGTAPGSDIYYFSSDNRPYTYNGKMYIDTLREGSMVIDMLDAKTRKVVWRSVVQGKSPEAEILTPQAAVKYHIPTMLKKLPRK